MFGLGRFQHLITYVPCLSCCVLAGKAIWKLDDPAVLAAEQAERQAAVAEAARRKLANALDKKVGVMYTQVQCVTCLLCHCRTCV